MDKHRNPDGTYDGIGVMSELTGMSRSKALDLWDRVKANQAKLDACQRHEFEPVSMSETGLRRRYCCQHCGGEVDAHAYHWYEMGRRQTAAAEREACAKACEVLGHSEVYSGQEFAACAAAIRARDTP